MPPDASQSAFAVAATRRAMRGPAEYPHGLEFPAAKLVDPREVYRRGRQPVVLVACGSFNPVTFLHLRMLEMAKDRLEKTAQSAAEGRPDFTGRTAALASLLKKKYGRETSTSSSTSTSTSTNSSGAKRELESYMERLDRLRSMPFEVIGGYFSPVSDAYKKPNLAEWEQRVDMCRLATDDSDWIDVDSWEASRATFQRTVWVLAHFQSELNKKFEPVLKSTQASQMFAQSQEKQLCEVHSKTTTSENSHTNPVWTPSESNTIFDTEEGNPYQPHKTVFPLLRGENGADGCACKHAGVSVPPHTRPYMDVNSVATQDWINSHWQDLTPEKEENANIDKKDEFADKLEDTEWYPPVRVIAVAGADLLESYSVPGLWAEEDLKVILGKHGICVIERAGSDAHESIASSELLSNYSDGIIQIEQDIPNEISSTALRKLVSEGRSIRYLTPMAVTKYIQLSGLYVQKDIESEKRPSMTIKESEEVFEMSLKSSKLFLEGKSTRSITNDS